MGDSEFVNFSSSRHYYARCFVYERENSGIPNYILPLKQSNASSEIEPMIDWLIFLTKNNSNRNT